MPDFAVKTRFTAYDGLTPKINRMDRAIKKLTSTAKMFAGMAATMGIAMVGKEFLDFDHAITKASAKFPDLNRNTKEGQQTLAALGKTAREVGATTQFSAADAAAGLDFLAMAGFNAKQAMSLLPGVTNLAVVADVDLARATDIASDSLGAFGLMTKNTVQLQKNFTRVQDVMAKTITLTNTNMEDLFESIKFGGPAFTAAGQSMETFNAIAGRMASSGIKGSNAGTALRSAITRLQKPTREVHRGLAEFNLSVEKITKDGKLMDMVDIMKMMEKNSKKMARVQRNAALTMIVGKNAVSGWAAVMNEGVKETEDLKKQLLSSSGAASKMAEIINSSLINQLKGLWSAIVEIGIAFMSGFSKKGSNAIKSVTDAVRALSPVFEVLGKIVSYIAGWMPLLIKSWIAYKVVLLAVSGYQKAMIAMGWIKYLWMMRRAIMQAATMTKAWGVAQKGVNFVLSANPIGVVIMAIAALGYAIYDLYQNWDKYVLKMKLRVQELILKWRIFKAELYRVGTMVNLVDKKTAAMASMDVVETMIKGQKMARELNALNAQTNAPQSASTKSTLTGQINVNAPEGTTVSSKTTGPNKINMQMAGAQ